MAFIQATWFLVLIVVTRVYCDFKVSTQDLTILVGKENSFSLYLTEPLSSEVNVTFDIQHPDLIRAVPASFIVEKGTKDNWTIVVQALKAGSVLLSTNVTPTNVTSVTDSFVRITVEKTVFLEHVSFIVGWLYFLAWSVSFYPQIYTNYKRKSVVGLNFDFLSMNLVGFILYSLFNCGLFWISDVEQEYFSRYPKGLNPVKPNDIFFSLHALFATVITIFQCFIYEIGAQRVSTTARIIHGIFAIFIIISIILALEHVIAWLDFLYYCSYVKLAITLIKYVPQAFYNYKRKSTVGWSIGNIFLDFTGGTLSMLQMLLDAYNFEDWESIFGDPTKFGLGFFSVSFDIFFIIQHYCLYGDQREGYVILPGSCQEESSEESSTHKSKHKTCEEI